MGCPREPHPEPYVRDVADEIGERLVVVQDPGKGDMLHMGAFKADIAEREAAKTGTLPAPPPQPPSPTAFERGDEQGHGRG